MQTIVLLSNGKWTEGRGDGPGRRDLAFVEGARNREWARLMNLSGTLVLEWVRRPVGPTGHPILPAPDYDGVGTQTMVAVATTKERLLARLGPDDEDWRLFNGEPPTSAIRMVQDWTPNLTDETVRMRNALERILALAAGEEPSAKDKIARIAREALGGEG